MDKGSLADVALMLVISAIGTVLVVAVHEGGHALAALLTGNRVHEVRVGDSDDVAVTAGRFDYGSDVCGATATSADT
jgi:hypothetical protein